MLLCKDAVESVCGRNCCCKDCDIFKSCNTACELAGTDEDCDKAYSEETALQNFKNDNVVLLKNIAEIFSNKKAIEEVEKALKVQLQNAMEKYNIKSFDNEFFKVTFIPETTRTTIDSTKLKKELPEIAEKYSKTSKVSSSLRVTVK